MGARDTPTWADWPDSSEKDVLKLGEGVGFANYDKSPTADHRLNRDLRRRLEVQDFATMALLLAAFACTVLISCVSIHQFSEDPSPALFYSDAKLYQERLVCESHDVEGFLHAFNQQPQAACLRIVGTVPREGGDLWDLLRTGQLQALLAELQNRCRARLLPDRQFLPPRRSSDPVLFDVSLDLVPFVTGEGRLASQADVTALEEHLVTKNPLEVLVLRKVVEWPNWEDMATNIRQRFRALGFHGDVEVKLQAHEELTIYRNAPWQNFIRNRVTQAVVVMSVVGPVFWIPYVWFRSRRIKVESCFQLSLDMPRYWEMLSEGLHTSDGFRGAMSGR